ncbi:hypothetical protein OAH51_01480 [Verrucomicrobia bacterium]|nr:hypothetical protein [Verrucomicrobiota bacterium]
MMTDEPDAKIRNVKINKNTRLILFLITGAIIGLVIYYNFDEIKKPGLLSQLLCKVVFVSSFFAIFNCLFPSSEKKAQAENRTYYIICFTLLALSLLFIPISHQYTFPGAAPEKYVRYQFLFSSEYGINEQPFIGPIIMQLFVLLLAAAVLGMNRKRFPKIKFYRFTHRPNITWLLIVAICLPVIFAPHEYQHRGNTSEYYKSRTKSKTLARGQLLILYRPLFTIPDPKASIGRTSMFGSGNFYVYHQRLRVDLLLLYWLLIVLLSGATFFAMRQKKLEN